MGAAMTIDHVNDTGSRHDWECRHGDRKYLVSYHYDNDCWTVQLLRGDGEREILDPPAAADVLREFPKRRALELTGLTGSRGAGRICVEQSSLISDEPRQERA